VKGVNDDRKIILKRFRGGKKQPKSQSMATRREPRRRGCTTIMRSIIIKIGLYYIIIYHIILYGKTQ